MFVSSDHSLAADSIIVNSIAYLARLLTSLHSQPTHRRATTDWTWGALLDARIVDALDVTRVVVVVIVASVSTLTESKLRDLQTAKTIAIRDSRQEMGPQRAYRFHSIRRNIVKTLDSMGAHLLL